MRNGDRVTNDPNVTTACSSSRRPGMAQGTRVPPPRGATPGDPLAAAPPGRRAKRSGSPPCRKGMRPPRRGAT